MRAEEGFQFERFRVASPWASDPALRLTVLRLLSSGNKPLPTDEISRLFDHLTSFGEQVAGPYTDIASTLDGPQHEPTLIQYDAWGQRVDKLATGQSSGSSASLSGRATSLDVQSSSGASFEAPRLQADHCRAEASSGSSIVVAVKDDLVAQASSGGSISYKGSPQLTKRTSSGGSVSRD